MAENGESGKMAKVRAAVIYASWETIAAERLKTVVEGVVTERHMSKKL